jgi:hypothetical protein
VACLPAYLSAYLHRVAMTCWKKEKGKRKSSDHPNPFTQENVKKQRPLSFFPIPEGLKMIFLRAYLKKKGSQTPRLAAMKPACQPAHTHTRTHSPSSPFAFVAPFSVLLGWLTGCLAWLGGGESWQSSSSSRSSRGLRRLRSLVMKGCS